MLFYKMRCLGLPLCLLGMGTHFKAEAQNSPATANSIGAASSNVKVSLAPPVFKSARKSHVFTAETGEVTLNIPAGKAVTGGKVLISDENGSNTREVEIAPGTSTLDLALPTRGYYQVRAVVQYGANTVEATTSAAVVGPLIPDAQRRSTRFGFYGVHGTAEMAVAAGSNWNRTFIPFNGAVATPEGFEWSEQSKAGKPNYGFGPEDSTQNWVVCLTPIPDAMSTKPAGKDGMYPPKDWDQLAALAKWTATQWGPNIRIVEVANEPDAHWHGTTEELVRYHRVIARAIKAVRPEIKVVGPCMYSIRIPYLRQMASNGLLDDLDGISIHAYVNGTGPEGEFIDKVRALKAFLIESGRPNYPIYFTEFGWTSAPGTWQTPVDELTQARYWSRANTLLAAEKIDGIMPMCLLYIHAKDNRGEEEFSVLRSDSTPKPSYVAYSQLTRFLRDDPKSSRRLQLTPTTQMVVFRSAQDDHAVLWDENREIKVTLPANPQTVANMMGKALPLPTNSQVTAGPSPVFLTFPNHELSNATILPSINLVAGEPVTVPFTAIEASANITLRNGQLVVAPNTANGNYLVFGRSGKQLQSLPVRIEQPVSIRAVDVKWPLATPAPQMTARVRSALRRPLQGNLQWKVDGKALSAPQKLLLGAQKSSDFTTVLSPPGSGTRYRGTVAVDSAVPGAKTSMPFDVTLVSAMSSAPQPNWDKIEPFDFSTWLPFIKNRQVTPGDMQPLNTSATLKTTYSTEGLNLRIQVRDDKHHQTQPAISMWQEDSIQIGFDVDADSPWLPNAGRFFNGHRVYEYGAALGSDGPQVYRWLSYDPALPAGALEPEVGRKITREGDMTMYDLTFPWRTLGLDAKPAAGSRLGFALVVNDSDGTSELRGLRLFDGVLGSKDPKKYGYLWLR